MIREVEDASPQTQQPRPAPLGRAPVQFGLVVVVVQLLWCCSFSVFVDVARRPAHPLRSRRQRSLSVQHLCCLAAPSDASRARRCAPQSIWVKNQAMKQLDGAPSSRARLGNWPWLSLLRLMLGERASLRVRRRTYGRRGAGEASAASSDRAS